MRQPEGAGAAKCRFSCVHLDIASNIAVGKKLLRLFAAGSTWPVVSPINMSHIPPHFRFENPSRTIPATAIERRASGLARDGTESRPPFTTVSSI
jgi:hypothetical protein